MCGHRRRTHGGRHGLTLVNKYMTVWGCPLSILSDNGKNFCSKLSAAVGDNVYARGHQSFASDQLEYRNIAADAAKACVRPGARTASPDRLSHGPSQFEAVRCFAQATRLLCWWMGLPVLRFGCYDPSRFQARISSRGLTPMLRFSR